MQLKCEVIFNMILKDRYLGEDIKRSNEKIPLYINIHNPS